MSTRTDLASRARYNLAKTRHRWTRRRQRGAPIVVFAIAKSGTSAVTAGLRSGGFGPVFQVHDLDPEFLAEEERQYHWSGRPWRNWDAQCVLERPPTQAAPWRVVSLVREPIAQSVSAFFQPAERRGYLNETTQVPDLLERFGDRLDHLPLNWFESHLEPTLGIDVYASEFDTDLGYSIVETPSVRLLLMRCEGLQVAPRALARLLDVDQPVEVHRKNQASEKGYGRVYEEFVRALRPSAEQLDAAYESRLVKHFYSAEEIERFRELWSVTRSSVEKG